MEFKRDSYEITSFVDLLILLVSFPNVRLTFPLLAPFYSSDVVSNFAKSAATKAIHLKSIVSDADVNGKFYFTPNGSVGLKALPLGPGLYSLNNVDSIDR